jgi:hypothetical protein
MHCRLSHRRPFRSRHQLDDPAARGPLIRRPHYCLQVAPSALAMQETTCVRQRRRSRVPYFEAVKRTQHRNRGGDGVTIATLHKPSRLALPWRAAGAASDERLALATMKAAKEKAKMGRKKFFIDSLRFLTAKQPRRGRAAATQPPPFTERRRRNIDLGQPNPPLFTPRRLLDDHGGGKRRLEITRRLDGSELPDCQEHQEEKNRLPSFAIRDCR